ncbi:MAG: aspartyl/asparaginyl beta-hydroxylase domain-containing protein [Thermosynechococcaceae cyanobacterium]
MTNLAKSLKTTYSRVKERQHQFLMAQGEALVRSLERSIAQNSLVGEAMFFDTDQFGWIAEIETNWTTIRAELDAILKQLQHLPNFQDISTDQYDLTQDDLWKTYFLYAYGYKAHESCARCPETTRLIESIPGMKTAFFSILLPHKEIIEHRGPYKGVLRYHLALKVPTEEAPQCGIRVGTQTRAWAEGNSLVFDDTYHHAAWNRTDEIRVILFLDFVRPMRFPFSLLNRAMIQLIAWSPYVQQGKNNFLQWEQQFKAVVKHEAVKNKEALLDSMGKGNCD